MKKQYFCNPLNMDYRYQFIQDMRSGEDKISREARRSVDDFISGKVLYFCVHDVKCLGFGGYGALGEPPAAGQPAAV